MRRIRTAVFGLSLGLTGVANFGDLLGAQAADIAQPIYKAPAAAPAPYFPWAGLYIGGFAGYGVGQVSRSSTNTISGSMTDSSFDNSGWLGGGEIGYNVVFARSYLVGLEGDFAGAGIDGQYRGPTATTSNTDQELATLRARAGYLVTYNALLYATGGGAYIDVDSNRASLVRTNNASAGTVESTSFTDWGWTAGGGLEWGFMPHWTAKAEYLYLQFDHSNQTPLSLISSSETEHLHTFRLGVNYLFN